MGWWKEYKRKRFENRLLMEKPINYPGFYGYEIAAEFLEKYSNSIENETYNELAKYVQEEIFRILTRGPATKKEQITAIQHMKKLEGKIYIDWIIGNLLIRYRNQLTDHWRQTAKEAMEELISYMAKTDEKFIIRIFLSLLEHQDHFTLENEIVRQFIRIGFEFNNKENLARGLKSKSLLDWRILRSEKLDPIIEAFGEHFEDAMKYAIQINSKKFNAPALAMLKRRENKGEIKKYRELFIQRAKELAKSEDRDLYIGAAKFLFEATKNDPNEEILDFWVEALKDIKIVNLIIYSSSMPLERVFGLMDSKRKTQAFDLVWEQYRGKVLDNDLLKSSLSKIADQRVRKFGEKGEPKLTNYEIEYLLLERTYILAEMVCKLGGLEGDKLIGRIEQIAKQEHPRKERMELYYIKLLRRITNTRKEKVSFELGPVFEEGKIPRPKRRPGERPARKTFRLRSIKS